MRMDAIRWGPIHSMRSTSEVRYVPMRDFGN